MSERGVYRGIYSALVDDPDYHRLKANERLVLVTARICKQAGPAGIFRFYPSLLAEQTGLKVRDVETALAGLEREGWVLREGPVLWIRNALRHDPNLHLANERHRTSVENALRDLPRLAIVLKFCNYYQIAKPFEAHQIAPRNIGVGGEAVGVSGGEAEAGEGSGSPDALLPGVEHRNGTPQRRGQKAAEREAAAREVIEFLNRKAERNYGFGDGNMGFVTGRLADGYTVAQMKAVISRRVARWKGDAKMDEYLRPGTLFRKTNFEQYVGELPRLDPPQQELS